jgi:hypothetical protein
MRHRCSIPDIIPTMKQSPSKRFLLICLWLGLGVLFIAIALTRYLHVIEVTREIPMGLPRGAAPSQFIPPNEPLGELGSHCGGPLRLPCRPGLSCSVDGQETQALGLCVKPVGGIPITMQLNEACSLSTPCATGLFCAKDQGICKTIVNGSPRVTKLTLEGMQFDVGVYAAEAGKTVTIRVEVENATRVEARLRQGTGLTQLGSMKSDGKGAYSVTFSVTPGMSGLLEVLATDPVKGTAALSAQVEALK